LDLKIMEEKIKKLWKEYERYAKENGFCLNPNKKIVKFLLKGILEKEKKYGKRYCPCRRVTGNKEIDERFICPCIYCKEEVERSGHCHCFLFVSKKRKTQSSKRKSKRKTQNAKRKS